MNKNHVLAICALFLSYVVCGQMHIELIHNFQPEHHLKQELKDNILYLDGVKIIDYVVIYHRPTETDIRYNCFSKAVAIDVSGLVNGHYTVMVKSGDLIVLGLEVTKSAQERIDLKVFVEDGQEISGKPSKGLVTSEPKGLVTLEKDADEQTSQGDHAHSGQKEETQVKQEKREEKIEVGEAVKKTSQISLYRVVSIVDTGYSSYETRFNVFSEARVETLIRKNQVETAAKSGRRNKLTIYAIYEDGTEQIVYKTKEKE